MDGIELSLIDSTILIREYFCDNIDYINKNKAVKDKLNKYIEFVKALIKVLIRIYDIKNIEPVIVFSFKCFSIIKTFEKEYKISIISIVKL